MRACLVAWPGCAWQEVAPAAALLSTAREVRVLTPRGTPVRVAEGYTIQADAALDEPPGDLGELVLPGGELDAVWTDETTLAALGLLATAARRVGAICNGVPLLARAGVLHGRRVTHTCVPRYAPRPEWDELLDAVGPALHDTVYVDEDVVSDGRFLTAKPWAAVRFARLLAAGGVPDAARRARSLGGVRDLDGVDPFERWVVELTAVPQAPTPRELVSAHVAWLARLEADGRLVAGGPFPEEAAGMLVLRVSNREEAAALAAEDPFVVAGVRTARLRRWLWSCADNGHLGVLPAIDGEGGAEGG